MYAERLFCSLRTMMGVTMRNLDRSRFGRGDPTFLPPPSLEPMPHVDSSLVPKSITARQQFWEHVHEQLVHLLGDQRAWVCHLADTGI